MRASAGGPTHLPPILLLLLLCSFGVERAVGEECPTSVTAGTYHCGDVERALGLREGIYKGETLRFLSYTTSKRFPAVSYSARDLLNCTGLTVSVEDSTSLRSDTELDLGYGVVGEGAGVYDAYITKSSWVATFADAGLAEILNPRIVATPGLAWASVLPSAKSLATVQLNGTSKVVMTPLDGDYWTVTVRKDLLALHGKTAPETIEEMVELAEYFHGMDLNEDGVPDYGFCGKLLQPQPWVASFFYFLVAPLIQADPDMGVYFDASTMDPLVKNDGWRLAAQYLKRLSDAGYLASKGPGQDFKKGRCAFLAALPGVTKKTILNGVKRRASNGTILWDAGPGASMRIMTPGSRFVVHANGSLVACDGTRRICPYEEKIESGPWRNHYVNRAPFFVTGGWGAFIRASAEKRAKELAFVFLSHMSLTANVICPSLSPTCETYGGVMDAFRDSHFDQEQYVNAGWTLEEFTQFDQVHSSAMGRNDEPNVALDLTLPGYSIYLFDVLETELRIYLNASLQLFLNETMALDALMARVDAGWRQTTAAQEGGIESQRRIYRRTLKLEDIVTCGEGFVYSIGSASCVRNDQMLGWCDDATDVYRVSECYGGLRTVTYNCSTKKDINIDCEYVESDQPIVFAMYGLAGLAMFAFLVMLIMVAYFRQDPCMRGEGHCLLNRRQPLFLYLVALGGMVSLLPVFVLPGHPSDIQCVMPFMAMVVGYSMTFGCLLLKTCRLYRIHEAAQGLRTIRITNTHMVMQLVVLLFIDLVVIVVWAMVIRPFPTVESRHVANVGLVDTRVCLVNTRVNAYISGVYLYKAALALAMCYMAYKTRNLSADYAEARWIFISSHELLVCALIIVPLVHSLSGESPMLAYLLQSIGFLLVSSVCVSLTLGPKIRLACKHIAASEDQASKSKQHGASMFEHKSSRSKKLSELRKLALNIEQTTRGPLAARLSQREAKMLDALRSLTFDIALLEEHNSELLCHIAKSPRRPRAAVRRAPPFGSRSDGNTNIVRTISSKPSLSLPKISETPSEAKAATNKSIWGYRSIWDIWDLWPISRSQTPSTRSSSFRGSDVECGASAVRHSVGTTSLVLGNEITEKHDEDDVGAGVGDGHVIVDPHAHVPSPHYQ